MNWKRGLRRLLGTVAVLWVGYALMMHFAAWDFARRAVSARSAAIVPQAPTDESVADLSGGSAVTLYGYTLRVPWKTVEVPKFGKDHWVRDPDSTSMLMGSVSVDAFASAEDAGMDPKSQEARNWDKTYERMFGRGTRLTRYGVLRTELFTSASRKDVSWLRSRTDNERLAALLTFKSLEMGPSLFEKVMPVYALQFGQMKGFQYGDPARNRLVMLKLFDAKDREFSLTLTAAKRGVGMTQAEINAMVASIVPPG